MRTWLLSSFVAILLFIADCQVEELLLLLCKWHQELAYDVVQLCCSHEMRKCCGRKPVGVSDSCVLIVVHRIREKIPPFARVLHTCCCSSMLFEYLLGAEKVQPVEASHRKM